MKPYSLLDAFAGIGGMSAGLERTGGFKTVAFVENEPARHPILARHWPEVPCYDDIELLTAERLAADGIYVDAISAGFPCQDIGKGLAVHGTRLGIEGERSGLYRHVVRLARTLRPRIIILENVSNLLSGPRERPGAWFGAVLGDLASIGYDAWWDCIPASAVGAPHQRDRIWIVAYARGEQHEGYGDALRRAIAAELSRADTDADGQPDEQFTRGLPEAEGAHAGRRRDRSGRLGEALPHAAGDGRLEDDLDVESQARGRPLAGQLAGGNAPINRLWSTEPDVGRVADGVPARVDRLHGLGNAVVPQIPEILGRAIIAAEAMQRRAAA